MQLTLKLIHVKRSDWLGILLLLALGTGYTWATWRYFTIPVPGGNDFLAYYTAWEAYIKQGVSPYSEEAALHTQMAIYGRPAGLGEDQNRMVYPFYSIIVHGPFVFLDYPLARALEMTLLQAALFIGVIWCLRVFHWRLPSWLLAVVLAWSLLYYPEARGVILGQFAIFGFFSLAGTHFLLERRRDRWAGALLVLSTVKPTLVFLILPFLLLWAATRRRWGFILGFLVTLAAVTLVSLILSPTWIGDWLYRISHYSEYTVGQSPVWLLTHTAFPDIGKVGELGLVGLLCFGMLVSWWRAFRPSGAPEFYWALGVTLVVSNLVVSRSATTNYVLMLVPILGIFASLDRRFTWGRAAVLLIMLVSTTGLWWLHFATVVGNQEQPVMFIPAPVILGLVLLIGRRWLLEDARQMELAG